ncbi:aureocin A53 family class IId bacteriocin [Corynebacterium variabile]|uniref:aureocin A53 family class IId bacteriocin n=1 Tax=Corynebacterium variabile TaxID=1727 RepID=UPI003FD106F8
MAGFLKVVKAVAKYGSKAVKWCWDNKGKIMEWLNVGMAVDWIVEQVRKAVGA